MCCYTVRWRKCVCGSVGRDSLEGVEGVGVCVCVGILQRDLGCRFTCGWMGRDSSVGLRA